ncbi:DUF4178 domain-containing protein [Aerosakkonemataceae cyanobacterium BLCC-F154]|uniref:DUF4178 domain-containing protein n=1 Tax=Floridaenema fluviatile BLCC-F154 TaxID=3153640 RepID=A0ABV4Y5C5_9CYAN
MRPINTSSQLEYLPTGTRLKYHGIEWQVADYSSYKDAYGYETEEWLLKSKVNKEYYLLRELDPHNRTSLVNWYIAEELRHPKIFLPETLENVTDRLWQAMQEQEMPYPELKMFDKSYYFESKTKGSYQDEDEVIPRTTWDYWDTNRQWNLALEAWQNRELHVYSTKVVNPQEFSQIITKSPQEVRLLWLRLGLASVGIILLFVGCSMFFNG